MRLLILTLALFLATCGTGFAEAPAQVGGALDWERSTPEAEGFDSRVFVEALRRVRDENIALHGLVVIRNGHLILEAYVHPYDRETLHNVKSVSKSMMSAVVGIALERGTLGDLEQPVYELLPEYFADVEDPRKKRITLRHLLTMTAGLDLDENGPLMAAVFRSDDWVRATFERPMVSDPGETFLYSTPLSHTMSVILTQQSGKSLLNLTRESLFEPLGIESARWRAGPKGYNVGGADLFLRPLDMAKFGQLFLNLGRWNGRQVVPEKWVAESTRDQLADMPARYGYWWWPDASSGYLALGWGGQVIRVLPEIGLIVVGTAGNPGAVDRMFRGQEGYEPSEEPLPANPKAVAEMEALVRELASPRPRPVTELPPMAKRISGVRYALKENPQGATQVRFEFPGGAESRLTLSTTKGDLDLVVGLDGVYRVADTGSYGTMPGDDNHYAVRGTWVDGHTFEFESIELGNPNHAKSVVTFTDETIEMEIVIQPLDRTLRLEGAKEGSGATG